MITRQRFADAYRGGFGLTVRFLISRGASAADAQEAAQAAWVRGWEAKDQLRSECRVLQWINSIAYRHLCTEKRRARRELELRETPDTRLRPASLLAALDLDGLIARCSKLDRSLLLHGLLGFTVQQTAERHGLSEVATRVRMHRSRRTMRECAEYPRAA